MPAPSEIPHTENTRKITAISQFSLEQLKSNPKVYESLLQTYCEVFSGAPWNEGWWTPEIAHKTIQSQLSFPGVITLATEGQDVVGFNWASEGKIEDVVPFAVNEYFGSELGAKKTSIISSEIMRTLAEGQVTQNLYWWCEMGLKPERRGGTTAARILRTAIHEQLKKPNSAKLMFGMTDVNSVLYKMVSTRGGQSIFSMSEVVRADSRVFMTCDINNLV